MCDHHASTRHLAGWADGHDPTLQPATRLATRTEGLDAAARLGVGPVVGPVPQGWPLWVSERANPRAWGLALLSAAGWFVVLVAVGMAVTRRLSAEAAGEILGRELVAGVVTGLIAWLGRSRWSVWVYPVVVLVISLVLSALTTVGRTR